MSAPAFVLCWSASEPDRVGEVAHLVPGDHRIRDDDARTDAAPLLFAAERPGVAAEGRPLHGRRTSTWLSISAGMFGVRIRVALFVDHVQYCSGRERALAALDEVLERGGEYRRVGDPRPRSSKFVLLAATNTNPDDVHPLLRKHARGRITTPTLAEHREDIPLLMRMLLGRRLEKAGPEADDAFWTEYVRVCSQPQVIERMVRGDYRNGGLFDLGRRMSDEVWNAKDLPSRRAR